LDHFENPKLRPLLRLFHVKKAHFSNALSEKQAMRFRLERQIAVEFQIPTESEEISSSETMSDVTHRDVIRCFVDIDLTAQFVDMDEKPVDGVIASATYRASFGFNDDVQASEVTLAAESEPYQYLFVAQAFPLAAQHFKGQLASMGMNSKEMPLGIM
jgi:hypothetical protein